MPLLYLGVIALCLFAGYIFGRRDKAYTELKSFIEHHGFGFRILVSIVLFIVLILSAIYLQNSVDEGKFDEAEFAKYVVSGLVVIGLLYTVLTFEITVKKNKEDRRLQLSQSTFSILSAWYNTPIVDYSKTVSLFEKGANYQYLKTNIDIFLKWFDSDNEDAVELRRAIGGIFNYFEIISTGIKEQIIDEQFVKRYYEEVFNDYYNDWIIYINKRREITPDMFSEFTTLVVNWNKS